MLELKQINYHYKKRNSIFEDLSYTFNDFGFYLLKGKNGEGKTTLFNLIYGLLEFQEGKIYLDNEDIEKLPIKEKDQKIKEKISYLSKDFSMFSSLSLEDNLRMVNDDSKRIEEILKILNLEGVKKTKIKKLSLGEKQRAQLAILYMLNKDIWLLDEPFAHLDDDNKKIVLELLKRESQNHLIIAISHDDVEEYVDVILQLTNKKIIEQGRNIQEKEEVTKYKVTNKIKYRYIFKGYWSYFLLKLLLIFVCSVPFFSMHNDEYIPPQTMTFVSNKFIDTNVMFCKQNLEQAKNSHKYYSYASSLTLSQFEFIPKKICYVIHDLDSLTPYYPYFDKDYNVIKGVKRRLENEIDIGVPRHLLSSNSEYYDLVNLIFNFYEEEVRVSSIFISPTDNFFISYDANYFMERMSNKIGLRFINSNNHNISYEIDDALDKIIVSKYLIDDIYLRTEFCNQKISLDTNDIIENDDFTDNSIRISSKNLFDLIIKNDMSVLFYRDKMEDDYNSDIDILNTYEKYNFDHKSDVLVYEKKYSTYTNIFILSLMGITILILFIEKIYKVFNQEIYNFVFLGKRISSIKIVNYIFNFIFFIVYIVINLIFRCVINPLVYPVNLIFYYLLFVISIFIFVLEMIICNHFYKKVGEKDD